jgi:hypothetical protein
LLVPIVLTFGDPGFLLESTLPKKGAVDILITERMHAWPLRGEII